MNTSTIDPNKKTENRMIFNVASMLSNFLVNQFQATIARFANATLSSESPLNSITETKPLNESILIPSALNLSNVDTSYSHQQQPLVQTNDTPPATESLASLQVRSKPALTPGKQEYQDLIQEASQKHGVPVALINAVIKQESNFNPTAKSHAGATGLMQLMPATAKAYGCTNSCDPRQNVMAGTHLLGDLLAKYKGNVTLALAGYNAGPGNVAKYGNNVPPFRETQEYVVKVGKYYQANLATMEQSTQKFAAVSGETKTTTG